MSLLLCLSAWAHTRNFAGASDGSVTLDIGSVAKAKSLGSKLPNHHSPDQHCQALPRKGVSHLLELLRRLNQYSDNIIHHKVRYGLRSQTSCTGLKFEYRELLAVLHLSSGMALSKKRRINGMTSVRTACRGRVLIQVQYVAGRSGPLRTILPISIDSSQEIFDDLVLRQKKSNPKGDI